jgi:hypothetical protein
VRGRPAAHQAQHYSSGAGALPLHKFSGFNLRLAQSLERVCLFLFISSFGQWLVSSLEQASFWVAAFPPCMMAFAFSPHRTTYIEVRGAWRVTTLKPFPSCNIDVTTFLSQIVSAGLAGPRSTFVDSFLFPEKLHARCHTAEPLPHHHCLPFAAPFTATTPQPSDSHPGKQICTSPFKPARHRVVALSQLPLPCTAAFWLLLPSPCSCASKIYFLLA